jgi:hypothetical protein
MSVNKGLTVRIKCKKVPELDKNRSENRENADS